jgi:uncharacterized protein
MHFNVAQFMREPIGSSRTFEVGEELAPEAGRVGGSVKLLRTDAGVWVSAELDSEAQCTCSRCLKEYSQPVRWSIEEECFPGSSLVADHDGVESIRIDEDHILDMTEVVRQYLLFSLPMSPLCGDGCQGIPPNQGLDIDEASRRREEEARSARWGALLDLVPSHESADGDTS